MNAPGAHAAVSLRVSVTDRCQLRCRYCMPEEGIKAVRPEDILSYEEIIVLVAHLQETFSLDKVRITGGEPLLRPGIEKLVNLLAELEIPDIALTTNGQLLEDLAPVLKKSGLHRVNLSLDSLNPTTFHNLTRGGSLKKTLAGIDSARRQDLSPVKLNMLVMRGINDFEVEAMLSFGLANNCRVRFLELMPIGIAAVNFDELFVSSEEVRSRLANSFTITPLPPRTGETSRTYLAEDRSGRQAECGFISPCTEPFCAGCHRLRLTSTGHLIGCLADEHGIYIRPFIGSSQVRDHEGLTDAVERALALKRNKHLFERRRPMAAVGG